MSPACPGRSAAIPCHCRFPCNATRRRLVLQDKEGAIMQRRSFMALAGSGLVCGCGAVHQLPAVSSGNIAMAQAEVRMAPLPQRRSVSDDEVIQTLRTSIQLVRGPAANLCHEMNVGVCDWKFQMSRNRDLNAGAMGYGQIVLNRGIVEYATKAAED